MIILQITFEKSSEHRWVVGVESPLVSGEEWVGTLPLPDESSGTFVHLHQGHVGSHHRIPITFGSYHVQSPIAWDTKSNHV